MPLVSLDGASREAIEHTSLGIFAYELRQHMCAGPTAVLLREDAMVNIYAAFAGLEETIETRLGGAGVGFGADIRSAQEKDLGTLFSGVLPEDLVKFGLIPEFIGRLPVVATVSQLDVEALKKILTEPRNALIKQYEKIFEFEDIELEVTEEALNAISEQALTRGTGARGLRAILEEVLLDPMYELPSDNTAGRVIVDGETVIEHGLPKIELRDEDQTDRAAS